MRRLTALALLILALVGCNRASSLSNERSPSATAQDAKSSGPATPKVNIGEKMQKVGQGDGLVRADGK